MLKAAILVLVQLLYGVGKTEIQQSVTINNVQIKSDPESSAKVGSSISLTCSANIEAISGLASQILYLFYKGSDKDFLLENITSTQQNSHAKIKPARPSNTGYYLCVVEVGNKTTESQPLYIQVAGQIRTPQLTIHPLEVIVGNEIELHCDAVEAIPPLEFIFYKYKNGQPSRLIDKKETSKNLATHRLKITEATDQTYSCTVQGKLLESISNHSGLVNITTQDPFSCHLFSIEPQNGIFEGDEMTINCTVVMSSLSISDIKPELTIVKGTTVIKINVDGSLEAKISKIATTNDTGEYLCNAKWKQTWKSIKKQVTVTVPVSKPVLTSTAIHGIVVQGKSFHLSCAVLRGSWPITYKFYEGTPRGLLHQLTLNASEAVHGILSASTAQSGKYFCTASNSASGRNQTEGSLYINITVKVPVSGPKLKLVTSKTTYEIGKYIFLQCHSTNGTLPMTYSLFLNQRFIDSIKKSNTEPAVFNVLINNTEDGGVYKCKAENEISKKYSEAINFTVTVPVSTPLLFPLLNSTKVNLGENVTLHCITSTGTLPITYTLYRNHSRLTAISATKAGPAVFHVTIKTTEHFGYTCKAENQISSQFSNRIEFYILSVALSWWMIAIAILIIFAFLVGTFLAFWINVNKNQKGERYKTQKQQNQGSLKEHTVVVYSKVRKMTHPRLSETNSYTLIEGSNEEQDYINISPSKGTGNDSESDCEVKYVNIALKVEAANKDDSCLIEDNVTYTHLNLAAPKNENVLQGEGTLYATVNLNKE